MPTLEISIAARLDGVLLAGFPKIRRLACDEAQTFEYERATGGGYIALPTGELAEVQALILSADQQVTLRLDAQSDAGIVINAGGLVLLFDVDIDSGVATNATVDNGSGSTAVIEGLACGT